METTDRNTWPFLPGAMALAAFPAASVCPQMLGYCSDLGAYMQSDGSAWHQLTAKRVESYSGTTDASGNYSVTFTTPYAATPNVQPVAYPAADSTTRVRVTAASTTGFTVKTERNAGIQVLGIDVLSLATSNVPSVPVRVAVIEA